MKRFASTPITAVLGAAIAVAGWSLVAVPAPLHAQQPAQTQQSAQQPPAGAPPKAPAGTQDIRLQRVEEQLLDLQGMIGTLRSLVNGAGTGAQQPGGAAPMAAPRTGPAPGGSGDLGQRVEVIETQIRALSGQMEQITNQLSQIQASLGGGAPPPQGAAPAGQPGGLRQGQFQPPPQTPAGQPSLATPPVQPGQQPPRPQPAAPQMGAIPQSPQRQALAVPQQPATPENPDTRAIYETAYNHLLRRDFASAESGFSSFLKTHPNDPLAGNAQYWLGETFYVRGKYRQAADSFLTGYRKYKNSDKAPANLLKLGMSLHQLGEKDAACATFSELANKFPRAPQHLKQRASTERRRSGC